MHTGPEKTSVPFWLVNKRSAKTARVIFLVFISFINDLLFIRVTLTEHEKQNTRTFDTYKCEIH